MCRCVDNFCLVDGGWTHLHDPSFSPFFFLDTGYLFLLLFFGMSCGHVAYLLRVCIYFFTCLVGMWHTFFGYASFISFFFIARILDGNLEKESHVMAWSFIECMDGCACYLPVWKYSMWVDVYVILIMGVWNESHKGSQQFDKAQWENKLHMWKGFSRKLVIWLW